MERNATGRMYVLRYHAQPREMALANVEDFWLEKDPQNVPGTWQERPNPKRRAKRSLEEFSKMPAVLEALREVDRITKQERA